MGGFDGCESVSQDPCMTIDMIDIPWTKPEEHDRVELVDEWNEERRQHEKQD